MTAQIPMEAGPTIRKIIHAGIVLMVNNRELILRSIYPLRLAPPRELSDGELLADCRKLIAAQLAKGRDGHWSFDFNFLIALRQAEGALEARLATAGEDLPGAAAA